MKGRLMDMLFGAALALVMCAAGFKMGYDRGKTDGMQEMFEMANAGMSMLTEVCAEIVVEARSRCSPRPNSL